MKSHSKSMSLRMSEETRGLMEAGFFWTGFPVLLDVTFFRLTFDPPRSGLMSMNRLKNKVAACHYLVHKKECSCTLSNTGHHADVGKKKSHTCNMFLNCPCDQVEHIHSLCIQTERFTHDKSSLLPFILNGRWRAKASKAL